MSPVILAKLSFFKCATSKCTRKTCGNPCRRCQLYETPHTFYIRGRLNRIYNYASCGPEASFRGSWGPSPPPPPQGKRKKEKRKKKRERKRKKKRKRKKGTMNDVKLLHTKCCFFQFFDNPVALKNKKKFLPPPRKS